MSSPALHTLRETVRQIRRRRNRLYLLYHGSLLLAVMLLLTLLLSLPAALLELPRPAQWLLSLLWVAGVAGLCWLGRQRLRALRSDDRQLARYIDENIPDLEQRLLTSLEFGEEGENRPGVSRRFVEQLWADARQYVTREHEQVERVAFSRNAPVAGFAALGALALTAILFLASDSMMRSGAQLLWPFPDRAERMALSTLDEPPEIGIRVEPGDQRLQRGDGLDIVARILNADPADVVLRMRGDNVNWQRVEMSRAAGDADESVFRYGLPSLREDMTYYVSFDEGKYRSREYRISVFELLRVEQVDVAYDYPEYTGMENRTEEDGGDMVVPEGTDVALEVRFNKPVAEAALEFGESGSGDARRIPLAVEGTGGSASFRVDSDAVYRVTATDREQLQIDNPLEYYVRVIEDQPPELALRTPGRDEEVMPLEEVLLEADASDDYGISRFSLHYTVIGQDERTVDFMPEERSRERPEAVSGREWLYLEDLDVEPGDFVSYYLTLADNNGLSGPREVVSDIYFLQVVPTDASYREAGGGGQGGGQGGGEDSALITLQKDIIAATWKLRNGVERMDARQFSDDVAVLAESQREAVQRARMSIERLSERLDFADDSYTRAVSSLEQAIVEMQTAAGSLDEEQVSRALQSEQQALRHVMRAEAAINRTDVSFQRTAGGGGGGNQENTDLRELFEMEMGQNENRYERPQRGGQQAGSEEASRLEELAQRQEALSRAQRNLSRRMEDMSEVQQRRELERLRREQEQLRTDLEQTQRQWAQRQSGQQQGSEGAAMEPLQRAMEQMQDAADAPTPAQAAARSQRALETLRNRQRELEEQERESGSVNQLARNVVEQGQELIRRQRELQQTLNRLGREQGLGQDRQSARGDDRVRQLVRQQRQHQQQLQDIESMLRALLARGEDEDRGLLSQAQRASRQVSSLRGEMSNSNQALDYGMINLSAGMEGEISEQLMALEQTLQRMSPSDELDNGGRSPFVQAAEDATQLREQLEALQEQIEARRTQPEGGVREARRQLENARRLAQRLTEALQEGEDRQQEQPRDRSGQPGQGSRPGQQSAGPGAEEDRLDNARSIRSRITRQDLEEFMNQPELIAELLEPLLALESGLRAHAELGAIEQRLQALSGDEVPEQYQRLVEAYYRALSDSGDSAETVQ